jgi:hypothetical protein
MKTVFSVLIISVFAASLTGQTDPQAIKILDKFSSTASSAPAVSMKFSLITINQMEKTNDTIAGSVVMSKDQYRLEFPDNITWFNGAASWNLLKAEKELTITKPDKKDDSFLNRPSSLFSIYKKGYKTRLIEETARSFVVDLYPEDIKSDIVRIRLSIGKPASDLIRAEYKKKDGITIFLVVKEYDLKTEPAQSDFTFNPSIYKGVEVIDMR